MHWKNSLKRSFTTTAAAIGVAVVVATLLSLSRTCNGSKAMKDKQR